MGSKHCSNQANLAIPTFSPVSTDYHRWPKWQAITALDIVTEASLYLIALHLIATLHMRVKTKVTVILAFSARLPVILLATIRLYYLHTQLSGSTFTFDYVVATQWQMGYAIMSSTITGLGPFLRPFEKEYTTSYRRYGIDGSSRQRAGTTDQVGRQGPRSSWQSEGYLMEPVRSGSGSNADAAGGLDTLGAMAGDGMDGARGLVISKSTQVKVEID